MNALAATLGVAADKVHVVTADVGGGFGPRLHLDRETVVTVFAARKLKRPVKWIADRTESFLSDLHARESRHSCPARTGRARPFLRSEHPHLGQSRRLRLARRSAHSLVRHVHGPRLLYDSRGLRGS